MRKEKTKSIILRLFSHSVYCLKGNKHHNIVVILLKRIMIYVCARSAVVVHTAMSWRTQNIESFVSTGACPVDTNNSNNNIMLFYYSAVTSNGYDYYDGSRTDLHNNGSILSIMVQRRRICHDFFFDNGCAYSARDCRAIGRWNLPNGSSHSATTAPDSMAKVFLRFRESVHKNKFK